MNRFPVPSSRVVRIAWYVAGALALIVLSGSVYALVQLAQRAEKSDHTLNAVITSNKAQDKALAEANRRLEANNLPQVSEPPTPEVITGEKGETGDTGETGAVGATGPEGPMGPQGLRGFRGLPGETGPSGPPGPSGESIVGPKGDKGESVIGPKGEQGDKGDTVVGPAGPQGPAGPKGDKGDKGDTGAAGPAGPAGPQGPAGMTCPVGYSPGEVTVLAPGADPTQPFQQVIWACVKDAA